MRYIKFTGGTGFCGEEFENYIAFEEDNINDKFLQEYANELASDNASAYEDMERHYQIDRDDFDSEEEYDEACEQAQEDWYGDIWSNWEEITKKEWEDNYGIIN